MSSKKVLSGTVIKPCSGHINVAFVKPDNATEIDPDKLNKSGEITCQTCWCPERGGKIKFLVNEKVRFPQAKIVE